MWWAPGVIPGDSGVVVGPGAVRRPVVGAGQGRQEEEEGEDGERVGHIVLCTQATEASPTFLGLETCRFDDGSLEGIVERRHARQVEGRTTWVLRVR